MVRADLQDQLEQVQQADQIDVELGIPDVFPPMQQNAPAQEFIRPPVHRLRDDHGMYRDDACQFH